jgi:hypothetical protein
VGNGLVIEIEDGGLGLSRERLIEVNDLLARPPDFDLADTDRLGLFVVAQLAARHGIKVTLRQSPYGGTTAIVLLPPSLVAQEALTGPAPTPDGQAAVRTPSRRGAAAAPPPPPPPPPPGLDPQLTGRHRRIAGFLQRTRELQPPPLPRESPEWQGNGSDHGGNGRAHDPGWDHGGSNGRDQGGGPGWDQGVGDRRDSGGDQGRDAGRGGGWDRDANPGWESAAAETSASSRAGLPRRVRRASLAPQLRDTPAPGTSDVEQNTDMRRSPEQARALMNSLQNGWQRGRTEPDPGSRPTEEMR